MIIFGCALILGGALFQAAARCPLGRAIGVGMNSLTEGSRDRRGGLD